MAETHPIVPRMQQYVVGRRSQANLPQDLEPIDLDLLADILRQTEGIELLDQIGPEDEPTFVVQMDQDRAELLRENLGQQVIIEEDAPLDLFQPVPVTYMDPGLLPMAEDLTLSIVVQEQGTNTPVTDATVYLLGALFPARGKTDATGRVTLTMFGETLDTLRALLIKPGASGHWSLWVDRPGLELEADNVVHVRRLDDQVEGFPSQEHIGWGQRAMKLDQVPARFDGATVRIGLIDSGIATAHQDLDAVGGHDFRDESSDPATTWQEDRSGHGSHCAGIIAGNANGAGIRGFAPAAAMHGYRIFEGGRLSWLMAALEQAVTDQIDIINLSLGTDQESELLHQTIQRVVDQGVALIAAAGNSANDVKYPARWPEVLAVAALGQEGAFPEDSYHQRQIGDHIGTAENNDAYFSARFTCFGPEIDVCAPGVAILSSVPSNGYAVWDGTSMAAPHITGLAALMLAHRSDIPTARNRQRVDALYNHIRASAASVGLPAEFQGAGLPDALTALKIIPKPGEDSNQSDDSWDQIADLLEQALVLVREKESIT